MYFLIFLYAFLLTIFSYHPSISVGQMELSHNNGPLMTPPISPALVNRESVINQGPMAMRSQSACPAIQSHAGCATFSDPLYQTLSQTNQNYYSAGSNYPAIFRSQTHLPPSVYHHRADSSHCPSFSEQQLSKDYFSSSCAVSPYSARPTSNFGSPPDNTTEAQSMQFVNSSNFHFIGNSLSGNCQDIPYTAAGQNGKHCISDRFTARCFTTCAYCYLIS